MRDPAGQLPGSTTRTASSWAVWTLVVLTALNFLNYLDRYVLAAVLERMKLDPAFAGISDARFGLLQSAFLWVYMVASPFAGLLGRRTSRRGIVCVAVLVWSAATIGSGLSRSYGEMLLSRALIGFGEAGYATVAPAVLSDLFSRSSRNRVLTIFYLATPVGSALGFIVGGVVASRYGFRPAFFVAGVPGFLFALFALTTRDPPRGQQEPELPSQLPIREGLPLLRNRDYAIVTVGSTLMTFAIGGLAFWMPTFFQEVRGMTTASANLAFGAIAVVAGIIGTLVGGLLGDVWQRRDRGGYLKLSGLGLLAAAPLALATPFVGFLPGCLALAFAAELLIFLNTGPLNTALVDASPPSVRELGVGLFVLAIHAGGDALSPPLLGAISDHLKPRFGTALAAEIAVAAIAAPLAAAGILLVRHGWRRGRNSSAR